MPPSDSEPLRVLYLTHHSPWPTFSGGRLRDAQLIPRLLRQFRIDMVAVTRTRSLDARAIRKVRLPGLSITLFDDESTSGIAPSRASVPAQAYLDALTRTHAFDAVHVEGHYLVSLLPAPLRRRALVVEHNVESALLVQRAAIGVSAVTDSEIQSAVWREDQAWREAAAVVALTAEDADQISARAPAVTIHTAPNGWDHIGWRRPPAAGATRSGSLSNPRLLFLANYAYPPNDDAVRWLLAEVFPRVRAVLPAARLVLAGANLGQDILARARDCPGVEAVGWVPVVEHEIDRADLVLCPLRIGGGTKVKTIEALRRGLLLVSTSVGVQGLAPRLRSTVTIADEADRFAAQVAWLCRDESARRDLARRLDSARHLMPTWAAAAATIGHLWMDPVRERLAYG